MIIVHLMREFCDSEETPDAPLQQEKIGEIFSGRDHSTISHAISTVDNLLQSSPAFKTKYESVRVQIQRLYTDSIPWTVPVCEACGAPVLNNFNQK